MHLSTIHTYRSNALHATVEPQNGISDEILRSDEPCQVMRRSDTYIVEGIRFNSDVSPKRKKWSMLRLFVQYKEEEKYIACE